jgi:hypothetical protein
MEGAQMEEGVKRQFIHLQTSIPVPKAIELSGQKASRWRCANQ